MKTVFITSGGSTLLHLTFTNLEMINFSKWLTGSTLRVVLNYKSGTFYLKDWDIFSIINLKNI